MYSQHFLVTFSLLSTVILPSFFTIINSSPTIQPQNKRNNSQTILPTCAERCYQNISSSDHCQSDRACLCQEPRWRSDIEICFQTSCQSPTDFFNSILIHEENCDKLIESSHQPNDPTPTTNHQNQPTNHSAATNKSYSIHTSPTAGPVSQTNLSSTIPSKNQSIFADPPSTSGAVHTKSIYVTCFTTLLLTSLIFLSI
ncbi:hypothetical protein O181_056035 [Austropuccinia psidii MF-1]|uniref:CFEM domain-containing protein n=1 Tax=Austropuccinia psidii MF-1 TaxID=1389203 RepID=A0A9Q3EBY4_9BASI|nr:hypothetical protein [Austropuccinia psidii MF-1]